MTVSAFYQLPRPEQLRLAFTASTFLARRWQPGGSINLYHLPAGPGLFIEIACADAPTCPVQWVRAYATGRPLAKYANSISLADLQPFVQSSDS